MKLCYNKRMRKVFIHKGFTMVELSLSLTFIATLSIAVVVIMTNAISAYHRGIILNQINTTGMELVDDMRASIQNSSARPVTSDCANMYTDETAVETCKNNNASKFLYAIRNAQVKVGNKNITAPVFGAFCTGNYSYIWNSGYFFSENSGVGVSDGVEPVKFNYKKPGSPNPVNASWPNDIRLLKINDKERAVCKSAAGDNYGASADSLNNVFDITSDGYDVVEEEPIELLGNNNGLAIYNLATGVPAETSLPNSMFYSVSFILGTVQGGINVMSAGDFCTPPGDYSNGDIEEFNYCAINKFNFAAQANGG